MLDGIIDTSRISMIVLMLIVVYYCKREVARTIIATHTQ